MNRNRPSAISAPATGRLLLLALLLCLCGNLSADPQAVQHLPNLTIRSFAQDKVGYIWIATDNGLCRYNGQTYYYYQSEPDDPASLPANRVHDIRIDEEGTLWIATAGGICIYNPLYDNFERLLTERGLHHITHSGSQIVCSGPAGMVLFDAASRTVLARKDSPYHRPQVLEADLQGYFWGGSTDGQGIFKYDRELNLCDSVVLARPTLFRCGCRDQQGRIWFGTEQGIVALDPATGRPTTDARLLRCLAHAAEYNVTMLTPAPQSTVYIGTQGDNIHAIDLSNHSFEHNVVGRFYKLNYTSDFNCGFSDSEGNVWIGTADRGYSVRFVHKKNFTQMGRLSKQTLGKYINAITVEKNGTLWIGSHYKGLLGYNNRESAVRWHTTENSPFMQQLESNGITALHYDSSDRLWVNIDDRIAICTTELVNIRSHTLLPDRLLVNRFCEDARRRVWAATRSGLVLWEGTRMQEVGFNACDVQDVAQLDDTTMLAAVSGQGIYAVDTRQFDARPYIVTTDSMTATALRRPTCLYCSKDGSLWIGTRSGGLLRYHPQQGFRLYTLHDGFASNEIAGVTQDPQGNTWVATSYGLSLITASTERVTTYFQSDRLQTQQFYPHCSLNTSTMIYFGGNTGLAQFAPPRIISRIAKSPVPLVLTEIRINSIVQHPAEGKVLTKLLNDTERIVLNHKQRNIDINYEAVTFLSPENVSYAYRLHGGDIDEEWNYVENRRSANYAHLPAGHYTFELKAQNPDGFWNEEPRRLEIVIKPSPLLTWYAFLFYIAAAGGAAWFANRLYLRRRLQKMELELARTELEREKELNNMKINFFTNISHELRTPLSLIYGPVNMLPGITDEKRSRELVNLINYNIQQLLKLIDQTLSLSRIENDTLPLSVCRQDIIPYVNRLVDGFACLAREKNIDLRTTSVPPGRMVVAVDADKFSKVLSNLVSNALKYTPEGGHVDVALTLTDTLPEKLAGAAAASHYLVVSVTDDGIGMSQEDVGLIFERYKRLTQSERNTAGTGIGLHYVKQLLLVHKGSITAEVRPEGGMCFTFAIPVDESLYDLVGEPTVSAEFIDGMTAAAAQEIFPGDELSGKGGEHPEPRPKIVLVEDNPQLQRYCRSIFAPQFDVFVADNGADGLDLINAEMPDVVITDVLMSKMDGYELCRRIRNDVVLSHIPVVILTAKVTDQDKIMGYQEGADVYMTKPFNPELLQTVVGNLLTTRSKLREMILSESGKSSAEAETEEVKLSAADRAFVDKLRGLIDASISDSTLNINALSSEMCMSRASFFRKIKSLTGVTPNSFILIYRLNRAAGMIRSREYRLNEVADLLGFSSQSHFSRCFKQHFGITPKDYATRGGV